MTAPLLQELHGLGVRLFLDGNRLRYRAARGVMTGDLMGRLSRHKADLMAELQAREQAARFVVVGRQQDLVSVLWALDSTAVVGLDTETTGLDPRRDRVRLLSLDTDTIAETGRFTYLIDCFTVDPRPLWEELADRLVVMHNGLFDLQFLARLGFEPGPVADTMLLSQLLHAGQRTRHTLEAVAERELGWMLNKDQRLTDWSGTLTREQLVYAAGDASVLKPLYDALMAKAHQARLEQVADIEMRCLPAVAWMARRGVPFDRTGWQGLAEQANAEADALSAQLDQTAGCREGRLFGVDGWDWDSPVQVMKALAEAGVKLDRTDDEHLASAAHPLAGLLRKYRAVRKRCTTYGLDWLTHVAGDGRVYPSWKQLGAEASGRMSCSKPNMQQLPRITAYRNCVQAPPGRVLVKADYSQIELRIAAKVANDRAMLDAYGRGEDLHTLTARRLLGKADVTKDDRQIAKSANFGLLYGMGSRGYRAYAKTNYGVDLGEEQAIGYRSAFFNAYPGLCAWHARIRRAHAKETRTLAGRRRLLDVKTPDTHRLNTPVQGTGADGLKRSLALLWERRHQCPGAFPVLAVHDEIVIECDASHAETVSGWLRRAMLDGMAGWLDPVPVEVEVTVSRTWGEG
jgi:DNA polymerase-1